MVQNDNFGLEIVNWLRLSFFVNENHTFPKVISLKLLFLDLGFNCEADRLSCYSFFNIDSFMMDSFYLHGVKLALFVWTKEQDGSRNHSSGEKCARNYYTNASHLIKAID